jgi:hypothetical protein
LATVTHPVSADLREDARGQVTHPLERLRGYIRLYVVAEGIAVLLLSLALIFWVGLLLDYGIFKAFGLDWVQELGYAGRTFLFGFLFTLTLALIQLFRLAGQGRGSPSEPGPLKAARVAARSLSILAVGVPLRLARAPWYVLALVVPFLIIYLGGWIFIGLLVHNGLHAEFLIGLLVLGWMIVPPVGLIASLLFTRFGERSLALVLERRFPKLLGDRLITAVELSKPRARQYGYSPTMLQLTIDDAADRVHKIPLGEVFNWTRLARHGLALALVTLGFYVCAGVGYCIINRPAGVGDFLHDFSDTAIIWFQRNILLMDTIWPRRAQLELLDFPDEEMKIGRDAPPPTLHVRALKWVVADSNRHRAPEGWRALRWDDLMKKPDLVGGLTIPPIEAPFEPPNWRGTVDEVDFFFKGDARNIPGSKAYLEVLERLEGQATTSGMSRRLRKLVIPQQVTVYAKGASSKNEQMLVKQGENEFTGALSDLKESIRFTVRGEDYYTPSRRIIVVPPPTIVRLVRDEDQPAYLYHRIPAGGKSADLKGKKQKRRDLEVSLTGDTSRFEVPSGSDVILTAQTDKHLKPDAIRFLPPRKGMAEVKEPIELLDDQNFRVRFPNVTTTIDFIFEFRDTDNVAGSRHVVIKPIEDQAPEIDVQVEVIRKTNQGFMITPLALVPFSGKVRDDRGLVALDFVYTVKKSESAADKSYRAIVAGGLIPQLGSGSTGSQMVALLLLRSVLQPAAQEDENLPQQRVPLKAFEKLLAERAQEDVPLATFLERLEQELPERAVLDRRMIKDFTVDPEDDEAKFNIESLNLRVTDEKAVQPHYVLRLWLSATDNNIETGPRIGLSREKFTFIVVSEYELLAEIAKEEEGLRQKLEDAVGKLKDGRTKLDRVRQELPALKPEEFSSQATQMVRVEENLTKSWDAAREVHSEYKRILKELRANRVQSGMIGKVSDKIVEPLDGAINQEFVRTDEALREFHKTLDGKKADMPAADKTRAELTQLIDRLQGVLDAMADVMTINDLIKRLLQIETDEVQEIQRLKTLLQKMEDDLLKGTLEPNKE